MAVQILRKSDTKTRLNVRNLLWKTPMRENGQELGKTQREPSDGIAALTLSEGEREGRSSRRKCLRLPWSSKESLARPLRSPWAKVTHQRSITGLHSILPELLWKSPPGHFATLFHPTLSARLSLNSFDVTLFVKTITGNVKWCSRCGNSMVVPQKVNHRITI